MPPGWTQSWGVYDPTALAAQGRLVLSDYNGFNTVYDKKGNVTYYFMASDIQRGIEIFKSTGRVGPKIGTVGTAPSDGPLGDLALGAFGVFLLPTAAVLGRRRRLGRR